MRATPVPETTPDALPAPGGPAEAFVLGPQAAPNPGPGSQPQPKGRPSKVRALPFVRDDEALLAGVRAGEAWARAAFFERYAPVVDRILRKVLGHGWQDELADLVHDTFVQAIASLDGLRDPKALPAWMQSIATHTAYHAIRSRRRRKWLFFWEPAALPEVLVDGVEPEHLEAYRRTYALLERLPADERVAFALRYIEGMELVQVAEACAVSLSTIKRRLSQAERRFTAGAGRDELLRQWLEEGARWTT